MVTPVDVRSHAQTCLHRSVMHADMIITLFAGSVASSTICCLIAVIIACQNGMLL